MADEGSARSPGLQCVCVCVCVCVFLCAPLLLTTQRPAFAPPVPEVLSGWNLHPAWKPYFKHARPTLSCPCPSGGFSDVWQAMRNAGGVKGEGKLPQRIRCVLLSLGGGPQGAGVLPEVVSQHGFLSFWVADPGAFGSSCRPRMDIP